MSTALLTRPATTTGLLTTTQLGIDTTLFKPVYLGRDAHTVDPWNAGDTITAGPEGVVFARHRDQLAMRQRSGRMPIYGYTVPYTSWSTTYGEARDRSNERSLARFLKDKVRHVRGPAGTSHLLMIKPEGLLHADAAALRYLTQLARDPEEDHVHDDLDLMVLTDETYNQLAWQEYGGDVLDEIISANLQAGVDDPGLLLDLRSEEWVRREFDHRTYTIDEFTGCSEHPPFWMPTATAIDVPHWGDAAWAVADALRSAPEDESLDEQSARHSKSEIYSDDPYDYPE